MSGESVRGKIDQMSRKLRKIECSGGGGGEIPENTYWNTTGNAGLTNNNFIGTTDNVPVNIKQNNVTRLLLYPDGVIIGKSESVDASENVLTNGSYTVYYSYGNFNPSNLLNAKPRAKKMVYMSNNNNTPVATFIEGVTYLESPAYTASSIAYTNNGRVYINMDPDNTYDLNIYNEFPYAAMSNLTVLASNTVMNTVINAEEDLNFSDLLVRDSKGFIGVKSIASLIPIRRDLELISSSFSELPIANSMTTIRGTYSLKIKPKDPDVQLNISYQAVSLLQASSNDDFEMTGFTNVTGDCTFVDNKYYRISTSAGSEINISGLIDFNKETLQTRLKNQAPNNKVVYLQIEIGINSDVFIIKTPLSIYKP